jgi:hypothetical protein
MSDGGNIAAFGWDKTETGAVLAVVDAFLTARTTYEDDDSSKNRLAKDEAKDAAKAAMRDFAHTGIRHNKRMKDENRLFYGIHPADGSHTPSTAPESFPEAEGDTATMRRVAIHYWDSVTKKRGKEYGIHGAEIRWAPLDHIPASIEELVHSDFNTASPFTLTFDETERGKRIYFCLRWESNANLKGPWGEIYSAIIP